MWSTARKYKITRCIITRHANAIISGHKRQRKSKHQEVVFEEAPLENDDDNDSGDLRNESHQHDKKDEDNNDR